MEFDNIKRQLENIILESKKHKGKINFNVKMDEELRNRIKELKEYFKVIDDRSFVIVGIRCLEYLKQQLEKINKRI